MIVEETDFPRGGTIAASQDAPPKHGGGRKMKHSSWLQGQGATKKSTGKKGKQDSSKTGKQGKVSDAKEGGDSSGTAALWTRRLDATVLQPGVLCLAAVREIRSADVLLELADGQRALLPANAISRPLTAALRDSAGETTLDDVFVVGQLIAVKVTSTSSSSSSSTAAKKGRRDGNRGATPNRGSVNVSCDPQVVNSHLAASQLVPGLVLNGTVTSIEEKGALVDVGVSSNELRAFLSTEALPRDVQLGDLVKGQTMLMRVVEGTNLAGRVLQMSAVPESGSLDDVDQEKLRSFLMPGVVLHAQPTSSNAAGVIVDLGNGVRGFLAHRNSPDRHRGLTNRQSGHSRALRVLVTACQPNSNLLSLSALPDLLAVSRPEKRSVFDGITIGDTLTCRVLAVTGKGSVHFTLPEAELKTKGGGGSSPVTAVAKRTQLEKSSQEDEKIENLYRVGTDHLCRVLDYRMMERQLIVSTRSEVLKQKMVSVMVSGYTDAKPGTKVTATVENVKGAGVYVKIYGKIRGFIPLMHLADRQIAHPERILKTGQSFKVRVLYPDLDKRRLILTKKPSLVNSKQSLITSYDKSLVGSTSPGYVVKWLENGAALVAFFNRVKAYLRPNDAARIRQPSHRVLGVPVNVRVLSVEPDDERMLVTLCVDQNSQSSASQWEIHSKSVPSSSLHKQAVYKATVKAILPDDAGLEVALVGESSSSSIANTAIIPRLLLSDSLSASFNDSLSCAFTPGKRLDAGVALHGQQGTQLLVTSKRLLIDWVSSGVQTRSFEELERGRLVYGIVARRHPQLGYFVELAGGVALTALVPFSNVDGEENSNLRAGQTVIGRVQHVDVEKRRFTLQLKVNECRPTNMDPPKLGHFLLSSFLTEMQECRRRQQQNDKIRNVPCVGGVVAARVTRVMPEGITLETVELGLGAAATRQHFHKEHAVGDEVDVLVLHVDYPECHLEVLVLDREEGELHNDGESSAKKKRKRRTRDDGDKKLGKDEISKEISLNEVVCGRIILVKDDFLLAICENGGRNARKTLVYLPSRLHPNTIPPKDGRYRLGSTVQLEPVKSVPEMDGMVFVGVLCNDKNVINQGGPVNSSIEATDERKRGSRVKQFCVYTATVVGPWKFGEPASPATAELRLSGGQMGRLHASELNSDSDAEGTKPMAEFLAKNTGKSVTVKVIGSGKIKVKKSRSQRKSEDTPDKGHEIVRFVECTMRASKLSERRKKQSLLGYREKWQHGQTAAVYVVAVDKQHVTVELNPLCVGRVPKIHMRGMAVAFDPTNTYERGEMYFARIVGVDRSRKQKILQLSLVDDQGGVEGIGGDAPGAIVNGRVVGVRDSPLTVTLELVSGKRALLSPTGVTNNYLKAVSMLRSFVKDDPLLTRANVTDYVGEMVKGFVIAVTTTAAFVEIGPGLVGRGLLPRNKESSLVKDLSMNALVSVRLKAVFSDGKISLSLRGILQENSLERSLDASVPSRKRTISAGSAGSVESTSVTGTAMKRSRAAGFAAVPVIAAAETTASNNEKKPVKKQIEDPGFDWNPSQFTPANFARIGLEAEEVDGSSHVNGAAKKRPEERGDDRAPASTSKKRKTSSERALDKERELMAIEKRLADPSREADSVGDFDRLLAGDPNSADLWIRYIAFFLQSNDVNRARKTAERALTTINFREEEERFAIWTAMLNMELSYGTEESLKSTFERAVTVTDALKMHKQMVKIYQNAGRNEKVDELFESMLKRFRHEDGEVWLLYAQHLYETKRAPIARQLLQRSMKSLPKTAHVGMLSRWAQLEYRAGDSEQGKTLFESILASYPRKTDVWTVYVDMVIKHSKPEEARPLFERVTGLKLSAHKMRNFFKKWLDLEEKFGDDSTRSQVRERAVAYVGDLEKSLLD